MMEDYKPTSYSVAPAPQRLVPYSRRWYLAKIVLRFFCFTFAITITIIADQIYFNRNLKLKMVLPTGIIALVYNTVELITFAVRYHVRRGIHPGFSVAGDLVLWIACAAVAVLLPMISLNLNGTFYSRFYYWNDWMDDEDLTITILLGFLAVIHFVLFVRSCIETRQRNASKSKDLYVYMYTPGGGRPIPVLPMKDQGGNYNTGNKLNPHVDAQSEAGTEWGAAASTIGRGGADSVVSPSVGVTERNTVVSGSTWMKPPSTIITSSAYHDTLPAMPTAPESVYSGSASVSGRMSMPMGDGFNGYRGPTDQLEVQMYHANSKHGQKEIIPAEARGR